MNGYRKGPRGVAERLHSKIVRTRKGYTCERCGFQGEPVQMDCAHIIRRTHAGTVTDERNGWCLCKPCHSRLDTNPDEFMLFVGETIGFDLFHELKRKALDGVGVKVIWPDEVIRLKAVYSELEGAS